MTNSINGLKNRLDITENRFSRRKRVIRTEAIHAKLLASRFP